MSTKRFIVATVVFLVASLGAIFGLAFLFGKLLVPPSGLDSFVTNYLGYYGPLGVVITSFVLVVGLVFLIIRKFFASKSSKEFKTA